MPSLEVLDIGRNKVKRLPTQPGSLVNLRVRIALLLDTYAYFPSIFRCSRFTVTRSPDYLLTW